MRFSHNVAKEIFDRSALKLAVLCLSIVSLTLGIFLTLDVSKEPIIVERACETKLLDSASASQTKDEIEAFVKEAVALRFDSIVTRDPSAFMVQDLFVSRTKEQDELKRSSIDQRMIVRSVRLEGDHFVIDADRLVAVGKARSAIPATLIAKISSKGRSMTNPYGLVLTSIEQPKSEKDEKGDKKDQKNEGIKNE
jgi:predicted DNA-binding ribbon-helix-helix protein